MLDNAVLVSGKGMEKGNPLALLVECKSATVVAQMVKNLPAVRETWVRSLGWEDPLEEGVATHSSILAWRIQWQRSLAGFSLWGRKASNMTKAT